MKPSSPNTETSGEDVEGLTRSQARTGLGCLVAVFFCLLLFACMGGSWPMHAVILVLFGWLIYPFKQADEITIEWTSVGVSCVALALFAIVFHSFLKWLHKLRETETEWPFKQSLKIIAMILFAFVAGISMIGIVHQITWMATSEERLIDGSMSHTVHRSISKNHLKQFWIAFHTYHDDYDRFPAGAIYSNRGESLHSWQTTLLPYVEQVSLFERIDFSKPWDDPENREHFQHRIELYLNPRVTGHARAPDKPQPAPSHYAANIRVIKPGQGLKFEDIKDGSSNTFLAGEVNSNIKAWGDPSNLRDPILGMNQHPDGFGSPFKGGGQMLMADGSVQFFSNEIDPQVFRALGTPAGGEVLPDD